jgi:hypothetical protein
LQDHLDQLGAEKGKVDKAPVEQDDWMARERVRDYAGAMAELSCCRHRFPPVVIRHAVWLYLDRWRL